MGALALGTLVIIIGGLLYVKRKSLEFLYNRTYWAIGALVSHQYDNLFSIYSVILNLKYSTNMCYAFLLTHSLYYF